MTCKVIQEINEHLRDETSKRIFAQRLLFSLTSDSDYVRRMVLEMPEGMKFYNLLERAEKESDIVIFGGGVWGQDLYKITKDYPWKCFVDSNPKVNILEGIKVVPFADFMKQYHEETFVISSRLYHKDMYEQLLQNGIKEKRIINAGYLLDELSKRQYFDLKGLQPVEEEFFVDAGSFDGMTSIYFSEWCKKTGNRTREYVYAFEPDINNAEKCHENLQKNGIEHEIIMSGCWNEETILSFHAISNGTSRISSMGEISINVTSIDQALAGKPVSFIKMDIEGAEIQALEGAKNTIKRNKPKLAISIYHKPEDIWQIPQIILKYYPDYKLYLRHYSLTDYETVLYALP